MPNLEIWLQRNFFRLRLNAQKSNLERVKNWRLGYPQPSGIELSGYQASQPSISIRIRVPKFSKVVVVQDGIEKSDFGEILLDHPVSGPDYGGQRGQVRDQRSAQLGQLGPGQRRKARQQEQFGS